MCHLCDKIYRCTESLPETEDCIHLEPEGVIQLMIVRYNCFQDYFYHSPFNISYCPECGVALQEKLNENL